jgi:hypothetical protein
MKKIIVGASMLVGLGACAAPGVQGGDVLGETAAAVSGGTTYQLQFPSLANKCTDVSNNSGADGANVQLWLCNGSSAQSWVALDMGSGYFALQHSGTNECLNRDTSANNSDGGGNVQQWTCQWDGSPEYQWSFQSINGYQKAVNRKDGKCLDVNGASSNDGTNIQTWTCNGSGAQTLNPVSGGGGGGGGGSGIAGVMNQGQFDAWFPNPPRNGFYTFSGLTSINNKYADFANSSDMTLRKREVAAFLANMNQETGALQYVEEIDKSGNYCDACGCMGWGGAHDAYFGRGPIQLSWACNYQNAGNALGYDLLHNPGWVASDPNITWQTAAWYWNTQNGPGGDGGNCHNAMLDSYGGGGFGETIKHINGALECPSMGGWNTAARDNRVNKYMYFCDQLGVSYGNNTSC